ncbi:bifunctional 3,4-dihydroxy-2-butanone-4-phosphate synthase/GTP cyclohydrolase II [Ureibacillus sp. FSL K6-8385]|uniref:Riboflavin biosynthesis protein RibBA n=2 Tax=Bacillati TaxID=1783272 RepID=A0A540V4P7_9BACL|nr:bifunctional 3,4-dihydroxy-2-butanone-4-phosphate synthase/GTP cyclohydrolase II [Ureibacillus terrenus]MED3662762.1 bifunctional 3,4-dihydroxy-2-butanone-4-phosphate synthase/GTP cyclohydrolase II [Ureibacillus terrenus]MED3763708.1 bifunctional 3,4-dihydroxy-2-butanone-4-phosphate synthase/GTP cyclohydrolase II [Ureibacillus terrenus]TQE91163.1 bifunctional 3,4-dihydroxy-2-butanone-4-phosphate synthase/GTP cyclohydrolase II [Ureibacillus terrenus]
MLNTIEEAVEDLKKGKTIIVVDDENRENEGDLVALAEHATPEVINFMATYGRGLICTPITQELAEKLDLHAMVANNTDNHQTAFTVSIDHVSTTTGISAYERSTTILKLIEEGAKKSDFRRPGHVFPLIAKKNGVLERRGHTEAAVDLARIAGSFPAGVICEIMGDDGKMSRLDDLLKFAKEHDLKIISIEDLVRYRFRNEMVVRRVASVKMPTTFGNFQMIGYENDIDGLEHVALVKGNIYEDEAPLVRIHSACLTGDVFHSKRCDCGPQLEKSLEMIEKEGKGVVLYMQQEGRGIGLINKLKAYALQEQGFDTVEANLKLGFPAELRDYALSAQMLKDLGITKIRLMTNNPEKIEGIEKYGIKVVERVPIIIKPNKSNAFYLQTKKEKMHHFI